MMYKLLKEGKRAFLVTGDVYRRDSIDNTHYPIFHQLDGVRVFPEGISCAHIEADLKDALEGLVKHLFGDVKTRWVDAYFPFTSPSFELEIFFNDQWLEVLGCGVLNTGIMKNCKLETQDAWAFGLGLERLAMVLFNIPDIRIFWSTDERFLNQFEFQQGDLRSIRFISYSKYPPCIKDITFWVPKDFHENSLNELIRNIAGDMIESVKLIDSFTKSPTQVSHCYRIIYRSMDRNLTNDEINQIQEEIRKQVVSVLGVTLR